MSEEKVWEPIPFVYGCNRVEGGLVTGMYPMGPTKSDYERGREAGLRRAEEICEEYGRLTSNPGAVVTAGILAKDIKREIERDGH